MTEVRRGTVTSASESDAISRYFLRRLAIATHKEHVSASTPYYEALVEVILVFMALPAIAVFSFVSLSTMKWWRPIMEEQWPWLSAKAGGLTIGFLTLLISYFWLGKRFGRYRFERPAMVEFDTDRDRRIAYWQKFIVVVLCGLVAPWLGILCNELLK